MEAYKTIKEKAKEWNVSSRHLQYLCKQGKVDGAVKKAGIWFVPGSAPMPSKYTKLRNGQFCFVGTRKKIFDHAIELFQTRGFEAVGIKDIAEAVGITQSSVYNHFRSKHEILDTIYDFYAYYFLADRPAIMELEPILRNGSLLDIITCMAYKFRDEYLKQMTGITTIIFYRCAIDDRAKQLTKSLMIDEGVRYVALILNRAVEIGRLAPMDYNTVSLLINSTRVFMLHKWIVNPTTESYKQLEAEEFKIYRLVSELLTDLNPPESKPL